MSAERRLLQRQLGIAWALMDHHLERLGDDDLHWAPADHHWAVRRVGDLWVPDFADVEPTPVPVPTAAWVTWHVGWWWSTALAHLTGARVPAREDAHWPGDAASTTDWLRSLHSEWSRALAGADTMDDASAYPWPVEAGFTMGDMCAWVNVELAKNAAELGQLLMIRAAAGDEGRP
ncbi:DinB family protein [Streptomyces mayonensis]|uniref:DinB family protein n=1 Tax=Streptomyces mayonensis TaxID=2750816 RepID=UPI001C1DFE36|nr:DinB family protein [Streptomyces sp. A108]MBU6532959.1 DinB family protein [Streptomyces sp. A108]